MTDLSARDAAILRKDWAKRPLTAEDVAERVEQHPKFLEDLACSMSVSPRRMRAMIENQEVMIENQEVQE